MLLLTGCSSAQRDSCLQTEVIVYAVIDWM